MDDWHETGEAAHAYELLMQEREEWLKDSAAQAEYQEFLDQRKQEEHQHEMEG